MRTEEEISREVREKPLLGKRHECAPESQTNIRKMAVAIGFNADELEELSKVYKGIIDRN